MITIQIDDRSINIPEGWEDVTTEKYFQLVKLLRVMKSDFDKARELREADLDDEALIVEEEWDTMSLSVKISSIITGLSIEEIDNLSFEGFEQLCGLLKFTSDPNADKIKKEEFSTIVDGELNLGFKPFSNRSTAEASMQNKLANRYSGDQDIDKRIIGQLAVMLRPYDVVKLPSGEDTIRWHQFDKEMIPYYGNLLSELPITNILYWNDFFLTTQKDS